MEGAPDHPAPAYDGGFQQAPPVVLGMTGEQLQALIANIVNHLPGAGAPQHAPPPQPDPRQRLRVREPDPFNGDRASYRTWKSQMERYLATFSQSTDHERVTALLSYIRGNNVDEWVNSYADQFFEDDAWQKTLGEVWNDLDHAFTDHIGERTALRRLKSLRQEPGRAAEYFLEFEKLMWMAGVEEDDRIVMEYLQDGICDDFRHSAHAQPTMPATYQQWKRIVEQLDNNWAREQEILRARRPTGPPARSNRAAPPRLQQTIPTGAAHPATAGAGRFDGTGTVYGGQGQPMEIDRARSGQCWRCGGRRTDPAPGCQNRWHRAPFNPRAAAPAVAAPAAAAAPAPPQRFRGLNTEELTELVRTWAAEEPEQFREAGFGQGAT